MYSAKEAAEMTGLSTAALRYYEKEQLLPQIARTSQKYRQYSDSERDNVADQLKELLHIYEFSMDTLSKYLQLSVEQIFIKHLSGAKHLLVKVVKYKRKDVLIGRIDMPEEK